MLRIFLQTLELDGFFFSAAEFGLAQLNELIAAIFERPGCVASARLVEVIDDKLNYQRTINSIDDYQEVLIANTNKLCSLSMIFVNEGVEHLSAGQLDGD